MQNKTTHRDGYRLLPRGHNLLMAMLVVGMATSAHAWDVCLTSDAPLDNGAMIIVCSGETAIVTFNAAICNGAPAQHAECTLGGPTFTWGGDAAGTTGPAAVVSRTTSGTMNVSVTATYTYSPNQQEANCPDPQAKSQSFTVKVVVLTDVLGSWTNVYTPTLNFPSPNKTIDLTANVTLPLPEYVEGLPPGSYCVNEIRGSESLTNGHDIAESDELGCGEEKTVRDSREIGVDASLSVELTKFGITLGAGGSISIKHTVEYSHKVGDASDIRYRYRYELWLPYSIIDSVQGISGDGRRETLKFYQPDGTLLYSNPTIHTGMCVKFYYSFALKIDEACCPGGPT